MIEVGILAALIAVKCQSFRTIAHLKSRIKCRLDQVRIDLIGNTIGKISPGKEIDDDAAYCSTAINSYICPANFLVASGYEALQHAISGRYTIDFVKCAVDSLFDLRESIYPSDGKSYPDNLNLPLVNIPPNR